MKKFNLGLFIFRRDLRLHDNTALLAAIKQCKKVIPCFVFDPRQIGKENKYRSINALQFMLKSLEELSTEIRKRHANLYLFHGKQEVIVAKLLKTLPIDAIFINQDYTPFSTKRDNAIKKTCNTHNTGYFSFHDYLLTDPNEIKTRSGSPYSIYTPYYKTARKKDVRKDQKIPSVSFYKQKIPFAQQLIKFKKIVSTRNTEIFRNGGRKEALSILKNLKKFKNYNKERDFPIIETTGLSAHIKFGTVSIREVYHTIIRKLGKNHGLIPQIFWHDFFTQIAYFNPFVFGREFREKFRKLSWSYSKKPFKAWCEGKTGFPIVDAGMRQLNTIGFMHNRSRLIVGSFLTKDLHIDWRWGEKYFAQHLVDYDPSINNGNWQWVASTGCDAQPYFRVFNPWLQQKKFDPECEYIKQWVPELKELTPKEIHSLYKNNITVKNYPSPIIDHKKEQQRTKEIFKKAAKA